jgi:hypothetical protein
MPYAVRAVAHVVGVLGVPAGVKAVAGGLLGGGVQHFQPVAAIGDGQADGGAGADVEAAGIHQFFGLVVAAVPAALVVVAPVPLAVFAHQAHLQAFGGHQLASGVDAHQLEPGQAAFLRHVALEQRAHAHQGVGWPPAALNRAHHRPSARFEQAEHGTQLHGG